MSADPLAWFELKPEHGIDHEGNLEPIAEFGLSVAVPQLVNGDVLDTASASTVIRPQARLTDEIAVRIIPDTRIVETSNLNLASAILATGLFEQIERPNKTHIADAEKETRAHLNTMKQRDRAVEAGDEPAPDATDSVPGTPVDTQTVETVEGDPS